MTTEKLFMDFLQGQLRWQPFREPVAAELGRVAGELVVLEKLVERPAHELIAAV